MRSRSIRTFEAREAGGALTVTALSAGFGAVLMTSATALAAGVAGGDLGQSAIVQSALQVVAWIFLGLALFVGGIVTVNTFGTIIAGRAKNLALLRLLGSSARTLRRSSAKEGLIVGVLGAATGLLIGSALTQLVLLAGRLWWGFSPDVVAPWFSPVMIAPTVAAAAVTTLSAWIGSKAILSITPIQALGTAQAALETTELESSKKKSLTAAIIFAVLGALLMGAGMFAGLVNAGGILIAFPGGVLSFIGFMLAADRIVPPLLSIGGSWGRSGAARLAARNTARNPKRATRSTLGLIIGVGLITMFTIVGVTYQTTMSQWFEGQDLTQELLLPAMIVLGLVGFSALLAAVGLVNSLTLSAIQRRREMSLLRALGLTKNQVKRMALLESARMTVVATLVGIALGAFYGWVASVSFFGTLMKQLGSFAIFVPWQLLVGVLIGAALLTSAATIAATKRTINVRPVEVLAEG